MSTNYATFLPSASYGNLLFLDNGGLDLGLGNALVPVQDGLGNYSTMSMSQRAVNFSRDYPNQFLIGGVALTADVNALNALTANGGPIVSVSGTPGQIDVTVGVDPIISIDAGYIGQTSITTLGAITTGSWNGTPVTVSFGGTGENTFSVNQLLLGNGTSAFQSLGSGTSGYLLQSQGAGNLPIWADVPSLPALTNNQILYSNSSAVLGGLTYSASTILGTSTGNVLSFLGSLPLAVQGQITQLGNVGSIGNAGGYFPVSLGGTGASSWTQYGVLYATATNSLGQIAVVNNGMFVTSGSGVPSVVTSLPGAIQATIDGVGTITTGTWASTTGFIGVPFGGTGVGTLTPYQLIVGNGSSAVSSISNGSSATLLQSVGSGAPPQFTTTTYPSTTTANRILFSPADNTIAGLLTANNGVLVTSGAGVPSISSQLPSAVMALITQVGTVTSGQVNVTAGGTGIATTTAYGVICGGTTATGQFQNAGAGASGQYLQSNGSSSLPTWSSIGAGGTFTPVLKFGGSSSGITYGQQSGKYNQIGNVVYFNVLLNINSLGSATGAATISGFPVNAASDINYNIGTAIAENMTLGVGNTNIYLSLSGSAVASLYQTAPALGATALSNTNFTSSTVLSFNGFYFTS